VWEAPGCAVAGDPRFPVIYRILTLRVGALTDTNPVVEGINLSRLSIA